MKTIKYSVRSMSRVTALIAMFVLIIQGCSEDNGSGTPPVNEVYIQSMRFNPATITVTAGTTVKWTNKDGTTHNVSSNTNVFSSGNMNGNATFNFTFNTPGTFPYRCTLHPSMTATVVVN